ncbi:putative ethD domain containing protein [Lyophyllum shimeji]|uniref:EthD domain containing protein n=1 Tax=Lyophyllum shimeji TaxID=47721 RepID=A0A9P3UQA3_LYOSH|nr:putative ethD domain containing protein [Lyophyllum shimeji]
MSAPFRTDRVRLIVFLNGKPGLSKEDFSHYWRTVHGDLFRSPDIVKVIKYEQGHANDEFFVGPRRMGLPVAEWDGLMILDGESYEKLFAVFASEEYAQKVASDKVNFIDRPKCQILPLDLATLLEGRVEARGRAVHL